MPYLISPVAGLLSSLCDSSTRNMDSSSPSHTNLQTYRLSGLRQRDQGTFARVYPPEASGKKMLSSKAGARVSSIHQHTQENSTLHSLPHTHSEMTTRHNRDPGLPVDNPTVPFWQIPNHPLANTSSSTLSSTTDVVIIGSGMTGCSAAKALLEGDPAIRVTVLEARGLASGATSRNGGHIVSPSIGDFAHLVDSFGAESAVEIAEFTLRNIDWTFDAVAQFPESSLAKDSKIRRTTKVLAFTDTEAFDSAKRSWSLWNK